MATTFTLLESGYTNTAGATVATAAHAIAVNDDVFVFVGYEKGDGTERTITLADTAGNTYTEVTSAAVKIFGGGCGVFRGTATAANATNVITATITGGNVTSCGIVAHKATDIAATLIGAGPGEFFNFADPGPFGSVVQSVQPAVGLAWYWDIIGSETKAAGSGFTLVGNYQTLRLGLEFQDYTTTGTRSGEFTFGGGTMQGAVTFAVYEAGGSDVTAPTLTAGPTVINITSSGFDVQGTPDESGTASLLVTAVGASQPSNAAFDASTETAAMTATTQFTIHHSGT